MRRPARNLLTLGLALALALLAAEGISRLLPHAPEPPTRIYDPRTGFRLRPGMSGTWTIENTARFSFNSLGFRDVEWTPARRRPRRIAVLGDSFAEALQVELDQSFPKLLERELPGVETLNFGVAGQGQVEELLTWRAYARPLRPDLVVLAFFPGNDPIDNWRRRRPSRWFPFFVQPAGRDVEVLASPGAARWAWLHRALDEALRRSSLLQRVREARMALRRHRGGGIGQAGLWEGAFGDPDGRVPDFAAMWELTERLLLQLRAEVAAGTGREDGLLVVCLTEGLQVHQDQRERFLKEHPGRDPDYAERRLRDFCAANGIPFVGLSREMLAFNRATGRLLHGFDGSGDGHYNRDGHRLAATAIAGRLRDLLQEPRAAAASDE